MASARPAKRARIVLLAAQGYSNAQIARLVGMTDKTVRKWRGRIADWKHIEALSDARRTGRPTSIPLAIRCEVVKLACDRPEGEDTVSPGMDARCVAQLRRPANGVGSEPDGDPTHSSRRAVATAPRAHVVAQPRPRLPSQGARDLRSVLRPAEGRDRALRRRENRHAGARARTPRPAHRSGTRSPSGVRVCAAWD